MLKSMTGYGKAKTEHKGKQITVEIRTLNNKQFDFIPRIPVYYKEKELELRNEIMKKLQRGKIELIITAEEPDNKASGHINQAVLKQYFNEIKYAAGELNIETDDNQVLQSVLRMPEVLAAEAEELDEKEWNKVFAAIQKAAGDVIAYRIQEGIALQDDILWRVNQIKSLIDEVDAYDEHRKAQVKQRLKQRLSEQQLVDVDENRFEQEVLYYLDKIDITEEMVRLKNHCDYFLKTAEEKDMMGKKLNFIAQEMNREINTIGSKAYDVDIQQIVVRMKNELEKVKEQIMNVL